MHTTRIGTLTVLATVAPHLCAAQAVGDGTLKRQAKTVVVLVTAQRSSKFVRGSGFILSRKRHVATNLHVVAGAERIEVHHAAGSAHATLLYPNPKGEQVARCARSPKDFRACQPDIAILVLRSPLGDLGVVELAQSLPDEDHSVSAFGFPGVSDEVARAASAQRRLDPSSSSGRIGGTIPSDDGWWEYYEHDAAISPGSSGGPLFDVCGRVVGVNTMYSPSAGRSWAVSVRALAVKLKELGIAHHRTEEPCSAEIVTGDFTEFRDDVEDAVMDVVVPVGVIVCAICAVLVLARVMKFRMKSVAGVTVILVLIVVGGLVTYHRVGGQDTAEWHDPGERAAVGSPDRSVSPLRVRTVPPGAWLTITREDDGVIEWNSSDPMPPSGKALELGRYNVEARKEGYMTRSGSLVHDASRGWARVAVLCKAPSEADIRQPWRRRHHFIDCDDCRLGTFGKFPEMVVVPAGCYLRGEDQDHRVTFAEPFAVSKYEVTYKQWKACAGCADRKDIGRDGGFGWDKEPALNVSWNDAMDYVEWLSGETKKQYRLLSESEWEYVARAGTETVYSLGEGDRIHGLANCRGCGGNEDGDPEPVGSFPWNPWGLHDVHGNVQEWVADCWLESVKELPRDGSAWLGDGDDRWPFSIRSCRDGVVRGGSWSDGREDVRSASRRKLATGTRNHSTGFRVARSRHHGDAW